MSEYSGFTKDNMDFYLKELAKQYKKMYRPAVPAEVILVGGAAILAGYSFRASTQDMDALGVDGPIKDAARAVADQYSLPDDWLNSDFSKTASYSPKLRLYSRHYRAYAHAIEFRIVGAEYLIAMKLVSGRKYKNDLSDIVGVLREQEQFGNTISEDDVARALTEMYGSKDVVSEKAWDSFLEMTRHYKDAEFYEEIREKETSIKDDLLKFERNNPGVLTENNLNELLEEIAQKSKNKMEE